MRLRTYQSRKVRSAQSEKSAAQFFGGRVQPASGALPVASLKGDVVSAKFMVDDKTTLKASYAINSNFWRELRRNAFQANKIPVVRVVFVQHDLNLYVIDEDTMRTLL